MVYSAGEGQSAMDRLSEADADPNSVFTRAFLPLLRADLPLLDAIKLSQERVYALARSADHDQTPAYYDEVRGRACLSRECKARERAAAGGVRRRLRGDHRRADEPRDARGDDRQASRGAVEGTGEKEVGGASRVAGRKSIRGASHSRADDIARGEKLQIARGRATRSAARSFFAGQFRPVLARRRTHRVGRAGTSTIKLWDAASGRLLRTFEGQGNSVFSVAFSPE